jgi:hypothetical protein
LEKNGFERKGERGISEEGMEIREGIGRSRRGGTDRVWEGMGNR